MSPKVWFITGASRGFGRVWTQAALARGDRVAATARDPAALADLARAHGEACLPLTLDVTHPDQAREAVAAAHTRFGRLDVVVNNAGYALVGPVETAQEDDVRAELDTNVHGVLRVIRAALPILRAQGSGHLIGVSSGLGVVTLPMMGLYSASKWALEALHEAMSLEVAPFGIKVTLVEPGAYATGFSNSADRGAVGGEDPYADMRARLETMMAGREMGDPDATAEAMLALVDAPQPPLRLALGPTVLPRARAAFAARIAEWEAWQAISDEAQGTPRRGQ